MAAKKDKGQEPEAPAEVVAPDFILLRKEAGAWRIESNVKNPERVLRIIGAQMVLRNDE